MLQVFRMEPHMHWRSHATTSRYLWQDPYDMCCLCELRTEGAYALSSYAPACAAQTFKTRVGFNLPKDGSVSRTTTSRTDRKRNAEPWFATCSVQPAERSKQHEHRNTEACGNRYIYIYIYINYARIIYIYIYICTHTCIRVIYIYIMCIEPIEPKPTPQTRSKGSQASWPAILYYTIQYDTIQYFSLLYYTILYYTIP